MFQQMLDSAGLTFPLLAGRFGSNSRSACRRQTQLIEETSFLHLLHCCWVDAQNIRTWFKIYTGWEQDGCWGGRQWQCCMFYVDSAKMFITALQWVQLTGFTLRNIWISFYPMSKYCCILLLITVCFIDKSTRIKFFLSSGLSYISLLCSRCFGVSKVA